MNDTQKKALEELERHTPDHHKIMELTDYATKAALLDGPLSTIAISNRYDLWQYIKTRCGYLEDREKKALFYWLCQEPVRKEML